MVLMLGWAPPATLLTAVISGTLTGAISYCCNHVLFRQNKSKTFPDVFPKMQNSSRILFCKRKRTEAPFCLKKATQRPPQKNLSQLFNMWWIPNLVSSGFGPVFRTGETCIKTIPTIVRYPTTYNVSFKLTLISNVTLGSSCWLPYADWVWHLS